MYIYIYVYIICNHEYNAPSLLSPQWLYGNPYTWAHDIVLHNVHHVSSARGCYKAIVVITRRAHCSHDYIYITLNLLLRDLSGVYHLDHLCI